MTLLVERPVTIETTPESVTEVGAVNTESHGGSYVTLPAGSPQPGAEGSYVTIPGSRNLPAVARGSYVTVANAAVVANRAVEGRYVTLSTAA
ncbi:hypothetical protein [Paenarthrobacter sp. JL.01a]|uniref:hypothetical protein n=1 Tax=Paenarthrobacter sp. JL.01a TaxID=2979324 RepID=UPI0021C743B1|nr:hypothetical protein [Paenarthrobacter sp. JL.01a]UXM93584.1 hypothetical protein N5P29_09880 [Paenarthrobacter sp. JL.01a]